MRTNKTGYLTGENYIFCDACRKGDVELVKILVLDGNVEPNINDDCAIRWASFYGHVKVVEFLLEDMRVDPSSKNNWAFEKAMLAQNFKTALRLLSDKRVARRCHSENTFAFLFAYTDLCKTSKTILDYFDPSVDNDLFIELCKREKIEHVKLLLNDGRINPGNQNNKAIRLASQNAGGEVVKLLLNDERVNPGDDGKCDVLDGCGNNTAIILAVSNRNTITVSLLLNDNRVDPSTNCNRSIILAVTNGDIGIVKLLLNDDRVDPRVNNDKPIKLAVKFGRTEICKYLIGHGANIFEKCITFRYDHKNFTYYSKKLQNQIITFLLICKRLRQNIIRDVRLLIVKEIITLFFI